jgi:hypothetical protein
MVKKQIIVVASIFIATVSGITLVLLYSPSIWTEVEPDQESLIYPDIYQSNETVKFDNIELSTNYTEPSNVTGTYYYLQLKNLSLNKTSAISLLKSHDILFVNDSTLYVNSTSTLGIQNEDNSTFVHYYGYIEFNQDDDLYLPVELVEIDKNRSLINRTEALRIVDTFLRKRSLINSSWELKWNLTKQMDMISQNRRLVLNYKFTYIPLYCGVPVIDRNAPSVSVEINPRGEILQLQVNMRRIVSTSLTVEPTFRDHVDALQELDANITKYILKGIGSGRILVSNVRLVYHAETDKPYQLKPCWAVYIGARGLTIVYI